MVAEGTFLTLKEIHTQTAPVGVEGTPTTPSLSHHRVLLRRWYMDSYPEIELLVTL